MNFPEKTLIVVFLVVIVLNIVPAHAVSVGEVNNRVIDDLNRYNNYGFWGKIWYFGEICSSLNEANNEYQSEVNNLADQREIISEDYQNKKSEMNDINSDIEKFKSESEKESQQREKDANEARKAINHNKQIYNKHTIKKSKINSSKSKPSKTINGTTKINDTKINDTKINDTKINDTKINDTKINDTKINDTKINDTRINDTKVNGTDVNSTNGTNKSQNNNTIIISDPAHKDADKYIKKYLKDHNLSYKELITDVHGLKKGYIVQIIKGNVFKYWLYQNYNSTTGMVTLITGNGNTVNIKLENFTNSFTGLSYELNDTQLKTSDAVKEIQAIQIQNELESYNNVLALAEKLDSCTVLFGQLALALGVSSLLFLAHAAVFFCFAGIIGVFAMLIGAFFPPLLFIMALMSGILVFLSLLYVTLGKFCALFSLIFFGFHELNTNFLQGTIAKIKDNQNNIEKKYKSEDL
ncbi:energy-coupling factor transporter transmembrane protein EcfT [Methanobacterium alcaliphilum]|uniref:energy-coupling factor transporter transmembrane protein EcfT n=1 Tax=Methanobacterium alcaliphilum TaxID=392018 RepID=UPI00200B67EF|nr:energy-coupling factor transporter transmembrane protein EcfT [Methanobacterium alcaliphilum]MCK9152325.1 energy-coupling factor transporter transmembrane protein EcfT [Methanobacterium alcaliphilum]